MSHPRGEKLAVLTGGTDPVLRAYFALQTGEAGSLVFWLFFILPCSQTFKTYIFL